MQKSRFTSQLSQDDDVALSSYSRLWLNAKWWWRGAAVTATATATCTLTLHPLVWHGMTWQRADSGRDCCVHYTVLLTFPPMQFLLQHWRRSFCLSPIQCKLATQLVVDRPAGLLLSAQVEEYRSRHQEDFFITNRRSIYEAAASASIHPIHGHRPAAGAGIFQFVNQRYLSPAGRRHASFSLSVFVLLVQPRASLQLVVVSVSVNVIDGAAVCSVVWVQNSIHSFTRSTPTCSHLKDI